MVILECESDTCRSHLAKMRLLLAICVVVVATVVLCDASCFRDNLQFNLKSKSKGCMHNGKIHKVNTDWTDKCLECSCSRFGLNCCSKVMTPAEYDRDNCNAELDEVSCTYKVTRKDDPSVACEVTAFVG
ncbi:beta-microseminoprotein-like [Hyperolius riggenbachi]|uniref:beta-microseminoprotein-like n=1 Tax=Hyperolius riggenbachi TaxID=752182 RepID=UPI0035A39989